MSKKFTEYSKFDLSNVNKEVLKKWKDGDIFHKSLETREGHLRGSSIRKRYAGYSPCYRPFD